MENCRKPGSWATLPNALAPDNGTAGWFMENFRDLLVMEDGQSLWIATGTPRAWLDAGQEDIRQECPYLLWDFGL